MEPGSSGVDARYVVSVGVERLDVGRVHEMLRATYWSPNIRREVVEEALRNSLCVGAYVGATGEQVGFARGVTDYATFGWLCDVIVLEEHRGHGLARGMVSALLEHPRVQTLRRWCLATRDAHGVYAPLGFVPVKPDRWMEVQFPADRWAERSGTPGTA